MPEPVIVVDNLTRHFGEFVAVNHVSFEIQKGEIVGYLGPNGSGKTTSFRMLLGCSRQPKDMPLCLDTIPIAMQNRYARALDICHRSLPSMTI